MTPQTKDSITITVDLSPKLLTQLDGLADHYGTSRPEALRMAILLACRTLGAPQTPERAELVAALERLHVANSDLQSAIAKIAKAVIV